MGKYKQLRDDLGPGAPVWSRRINECLQNANITQADLSAMCGNTPSPATITAWIFGDKNGKRTEPKVLGLKIVAEKLGVSVDYLLGSTIKTPDVEIIEICRKTGLSEEAISFLINMTVITNSFKKQDEHNPYAASEVFTNTEMISALLEKVEFMDVLPKFDELHRYCKKNGKDEIYDFNVFLLQNMLRDLILCTLDNLSVIENKKITMAYVQPPNL